MSSTDVDLTISRLDEKWLQLKKAADEVFRDCTEDSVAQLEMDTRLELVMAGAFTLVLCSHALKRITNQPVVPDVQLQQKVRLVRDYQTKIQTADVGERARQRSHAAAAGSRPARLLRVRADKRSRTTSDLVGAVDHSGGASNSSGGGSGGVTAMTTPIAATLGAMDAIQNETADRLSAGGDDDDDEGPGKTTSGPTATKPLLRVNKEAVARLTKL